MSFYVEEVFSELAWQIRVQSYEGLESNPKFVSRKLELFKHFLDAEVADILAVKKNDASVNHEALLEYRVFDDGRQIFLIHKASPLFLRKCLIHKAATNLVNRFQVLLFELNTVVFVRPSNNPLQIQFF